MAFIIEISDNYVTDHYGPFDSIGDAAAWLVPAFAGQGCTLRVDGTDIIRVYRSVYQQPGDPPREVGVGEIIPVSREIKTPHIWMEGH